MDNTVRILGPRGSVPTSGFETVWYGGATTCVLVQMAGQRVLLDAGSGMVDLPEDICLSPSLTLLLSHFHLDHLVGLPMCPFVLCHGKRLDIYSVPRDGVDAKTALSRVYAPPVWPVIPEKLPARLIYHHLPETLELGDLRVDVMEGVHPGGVSLFRLTGDGKSMVFITDCTLTAHLLPKVTEFAKDCDLLLCDGQYTEDEWVHRIHYGHTTWIAAAKFGKACGARHVRIIHHDPSRTDAVLDAAGAELLSIHPHCSFAYQDEVITL